MRAWNAENEFETVHDVSLYLLGGHNHTARQVDEEMHHLLNYILLAVITPNRPGKSAVD